MAENYRMNLRRLRQSPAVRALVRETRVSVDQMMQPLFVAEGIKSREPVPYITGTFRETPETLLRTIESDLKAGVSKFLLFGVPEAKQESHFKVDFLAHQIEAIRKNFGKSLFLATDVCLCSMTTHGHCGVLTAEGDHVKNDATVHELAQVAVAYAQAGADCVAPSDMMDGRVAAIRAGLDRENLDQTLLMSYSAKFHSRFYGPFRVAADSAPKGRSGLKDRATYQIDPGCPRDAYLSSVRDAEEGADILMVKPGMPYLDILAKLSAEIQVPWAVYEVSGEYASIELMAEKGLMDAPLAHCEAWTALVRAGANILITYGARYAKDYLLRSHG